MASSSSSKLTSRKEETPPQPQPPPQSQQPPLSTTTNAIAIAIARAQAQAPAQGPASTSHDASLFPSQEDICLANSSHLTRLEVLRRRVRRIRKLSKVYRDYYWALMEDLRVQYREYYWQFGVSPYKEEDERESGGEREFGFNAEGCGETNANNNNNNNEAGACGGSSGGNNRCTFVGCKLKAMALTKFCHLHILSDPEQNLYKPCKFVIKSAQAGPILCGKPILSASIPSLCNIHSQKSQKHATRALKKSGLNASSSSKLAPHLNLVFSEYVKLIQSKRRAAAQKADNRNIAIKEESTS